MKAQKIVLVLALQFLSVVLIGQSVNLRYCPSSFSRNNGNGQEVKVFAANILPGSVYAQLAQKSGNQGNLFFSWDAAVIYPPVIQRTWLTGADGVTTLNWAFAEPTGSYFNPPGVPSGSQVGYTFYNENLPPAQYITLEFVDPIDGQAVGLCTYDFSAGTSGSLITTDVSSGADGGLESKSIGTALAERVFNREIKSKAAVAEYPKMAKYAQLKTAANEITEFIPDKAILGAGYQMYETSPKDITTFTNAKNVVAMDYVFAGINKAVVFCTYTEGGAYTHTKQVCDRLKGSELLGIDSVTMRGLKVLKHIYKKKNKYNEYALTFTLGKKNNAKEYSFQSEWLIDKVQAQDSLFNFQIWSSDPSVLAKLFSSVVDKFQAKAPISQIQSPQKPSYYVTKASRDTSNPYLLNLLIRNDGETKQISVKVQSKANEQSTSRETKEYQFDINPKAETTVQLNLMDTAESEISMRDATQPNSKNTDFVYSNDGIWNIFMPNGEKPEEYVVYNDQTAPQAGEYRMFRNVQIKAKTKDYLTVYRIINGGAEAADMSTYKGVKFTLKGQSKVRIRIIKKGIKNYDEQFQYLLIHGGETKTFLIPFSKFSNGKQSGGFETNDLENISFSFENEGVFKDINVQLSELKFVSDISQFSENQFVLANEPVAPSFTIAPNPASTHIQINGYSARPEQVQIQLSNLAGKVVLTQNQQQAQGNWKWSLPLKGQFQPGLYLISIKNSNSTLVHKLLVQ